MDPIKDIQKQDALAKFIDGQQVRTNPFGENRSGERAYRRAERIVAGIHLLTNHISSGEPLRTSVRSECIKLLALTLALRDEMRASESENVGAFQASVRYLISLIRMLGAAGCISLQNADAVISALDELGTFIVISQRSGLSESLSLSRDDLLGPMSFIKDIKDRRIIKDIGAIKDVEKTSTDISSDGSPSQRAQGILEILRSGKDMSLTDIAANLPEYSEKMIQRELAALVALGRVKKAGLKRWTRYSIAQ